LLDLKIRVITRDRDGAAVPLQQDVRAVDYQKEFVTFLESRNLDAGQKSYVERCGLSVLKTVMEKHREDAE